jgi:hypothetical protein
MDSRVALAGWFFHNVCAVGDHARERIIPNINSGVCRTCALPRLVGGETPSRCIACMRFRVRAPILSSSGFCHCPCDCYDAPQLEDADTFHDSEIDEDYSDGSGEGSETASVSSEMSIVDDRHSVNLEEAQQLHEGVSMWEVHDMVTSGVPRERLMEQFPELEQIHGWRRSEEPDIPTPVICCADCQRPMFREVVEAISRSVVRCCEQCARPMLAAGESEGLEGAYYLDHCRCRCVCENDEDKEDEPCYLPFMPNGSRHMLAPWVEEELQRRGFCLGDTCRETGWCAVRTELNLPTLAQIIAHTYEDDWRRNERESREAYLDYLNGSHFPNGIARASTVSGLPYVLEAYFRSVDPTAFGDPDASNTSSSSHELDFDNGFDGLPDLGSEGLLEETTRISDLHSWISQNEWRLEEDDAVSVCTADDLGLDRQDYVSGLDEAQTSGREANVLDNHTYRHIYRRYVRVAQLGGRNYLETDLVQVVWSELGFLDYMDDDGREVNSDGSITYWHLAGGRLGTRNDWLMERAEDRILEQLRQEVGDHDSEGWQQLLGLHEVRRRQLAALPIETLEGIAEGEIPVQVSVQRVDRSQAELVSASSALEVQESPGPEEQDQREY